MKLRVIALDYDGTIAERGVLHSDVRAAALEARARGVRVVLATGRIVESLERVAGTLDFVDGVVAENGPVLWLPDRRRGLLLGPPPPLELAAALRARGHDVVLGECVIELDAAAAPDVIEEIRTRSLPRVILFNQDRLMVLPPGAGKASGLVALLDLLHASRHETLAVGNAENDHDFLASVAYGAAVEWGSAPLVAAADHVVEGTGAESVAALMRAFVRREWLPPARAERDAIVIGAAPDGARISIPARGANVVIAGEPGTGRSWIAGLLAEQHVLARRPTCVFDGARELSALATLPGIVRFGDHGLPAREQLSAAMADGERAALVELGRAPRRDHESYLSAALPVIGTLRRDHGRPHVVVVDEMDGLRDPDALEWRRGGWVVVMPRASALPREVLAGAHVIVTRETDPDEAAALHERLESEAPQRAFRDTLAERDLGEAVLVGARGLLVPFRIAPSLTPPQPRS